MLTASTICQERRTKNQKTNAEKSAERLEAIEIADKRTKLTPDDLARNVGAETDGDPGTPGTPQGDGNSQRSGDEDMSSNSGTSADQ
ncbi:hypothetical protein [Rhodanobacter sp. BL-MT-08]